jgi:hypothetical protein
MKISRALAFALGAMALVWGVSASAQQAPITYRLLENANSSGPQVGVRGGNYVLNIGGTFGGTTLTFSEIIDGISTTLEHIHRRGRQMFQSPDRRAGPDHGIWRLAQRIECLARQ